MKSTLNFEHFEKKDGPHRFCITEIMDSKKVVRYMSEKSRFRRPFDKQHGKRAQALFTSASHHHYQIHWSLPSQLSCKKYFLLRWKILGLLLNTLAADEMYPVLNRDNLTIQILMQLSEKEKSFSQFPAAFLKCSWNFERLKKKDNPHRFCISEITDS